MIERARAFWLSRTRGSAASLFRIAFALCALREAFSVLANVERYYTDAGFVPWSVVQGRAYQALSLFALAPHDPLLPRLVALAFVVAAAGLLVGFHSRGCALAVFVLELSLQHRNPFIENAGDRLFLILAFLSAFSPLGARWSVDALLERRRPPLSDPPALFQRLMAVQVAFVYLNAFAGKIGQASWRAGDAVREILASPALSSAPLLLSRPLGALLTWSTLVFELLFPLLVWSRPWRPYLLLAGLAFHVGIQWCLGIPGFGEVMIASYACFLTDDEAELLVAQLARPFKQPALR